MREPSSAGPSGPRLSSRVQGLAPDGDDGWGLYYKARALIDAGEPVVMLTIGDHDVPVEGAILDAMDASARGGNTGYAPLTGSASLRAAVAEIETARSGIATTADQVVVTPGGQAAIFAALSAVLDPGDGCVLLDPFYTTFPMTVRAVGGVPVIVPTRPEDGFQPDAGAIEAALTPRTRAVLVNSPNNPTGVIHSPQRAEALCALARRHDLWIVSDELYADQVHDGVHMHFRALPGMADRVIQIGSMSKSHGMTGFRVGWTVAPLRASAMIGHVATATTYGIPGFVQDAAEAALRAGPAVPEGIAARYRSRRDLALAALGNGAGARPVRPQAGMYLVVDIRETGLTGTAFAEALLDRHRIAVMPGESFGTAAAGHVRIALTVPDAALGQAVATLGRFAAELAETSGR